MEHRDQEQSEAGSNGIEVVLYTHQSPISRVSAQYAVYYHTQNISLFRLGDTPRQGLQCILSPVDWAGLDWIYIYIYIYIGCLKIYKTH